MDTKIRNPTLLLRLFGLFLLRAAQRTFCALLLNEPPRRTRCLRAYPRNKQPKLRIAEPVEAAGPVDLAVFPQCRPEKAASVLVPAGLVLEGRVELEDA